MEGSGSLSRSLIGRAPNFTTTRRATGGQKMVSGYGRYDPRAGIGPSNLSTQGTHPRYGGGGFVAPPPVTPMPTASGTRFGHRAEDGRNWDTRSYDERVLGSEGDFGGPPPGSRDFGLQSVGTIGDHWMVDENLEAGRYSDAQKGAAYEPRAGWSDPRVSKFDEIKSAAFATAGKVEGLDRDEIIGTVQAAYAGFEAQAAQWRALRDEALKDGEAEVAAQYDRQIRNEQQAIDDLKREIQVAGDVESWYREIVEAPYIAAREAAANVNFQPTLDLKANSVSRIDEEYFGVNERLDSVLADIGFTPEQRDALKLGAAEDNAVAAAQMEVLDATAMRPGMLQAKKSLMFHTADQLRLAELRKSAGNELVEVEPRKRAIAERAEEIGFLTKEKADAMARTRRAVQRQYAEGPMMPSRDEIVETAMNTMMESLGADLPPGQRQAYLDAAWSMINGGFTDASPATLYEAFEAGAIRPDQATADALRQMVQIAEAEGWTDAKFQLEKRRLVEGMFDADDKVIFQSLLDTYGTAMSEAEQIINDRRSFQSGTQNAQNADPRNIADAKAGEGIYGDRARQVVEYAKIFQDMGIRVGGQNYFRPASESTKDKGRDPNSDHITGGALDLYFDYNDKDQMAFYNSRVRPILDQWASQGLVSLVLHPGTNKYHMDHAHVSFSLGEGDGYYSTSGHFSNDGHDHSQDAVGAGAGAAR